MQYTVLGDTVNVAARLQEADKTTGSDLVISEDLLDRAGGLPRLPALGLHLKTRPSGAHRSGCPYLSIWARFLSNASVGIERTLNNRIHEFRVRQGCHMTAVIRLFKSPVRDVFAHK